MGNCLASTPIEHYQSYFENIKVSEIQDYWTTYQVFKLKKIYDQVSTTHPEYSKYTHIEEQAFVDLFSELHEYPEKQKQRFYQIFNYDGHGFVDWNNFFSMISICYFASNQTIAVILFLIFDQSLSKQLTKPELELMVEQNKNCIVNQDIEDEIPKYDKEEVVKGLLNGSSTLSLSYWVENFNKYFCASKIRKIFNIFSEEKLEKQLVKHFSEWNSLYNEEQQRYVSYLINYKWFQSWKIYVKNQYGVNLQSQQGKKPVTFKTRKLLKGNKKQTSTKKIAENLTLRELKWENTIKNQEISSDCPPQEIKNYDFVHSNIGEKPHQIYNNVLEGEYEQVLKDSLIENRDYVLISEKVWKNLKKIYHGSPQFRRTGSDFIELYPKILKILKFSNGNIDYSDGTIKEVSGYYGVGDVLDIIFKSDQPQESQYFFKCIGMKKWEKIEDFDDALVQLTNEIMIFIISVPNNEEQTFVKSKCKGARDISEISVGDFVKYENQITKSSQTMVVMGKNVEGKYILHIPGESYIYDICVLENQLFKKGSLVSTDSVVLKNGVKLPPIQEFKMKKKQEIGLVGIPPMKGMGFINSTIIHLYHNSQFRKMLSLLKEQSIQEQYTSGIQILKKIFKDLEQKKKVDTSSIMNMIEELLPDFIHFSGNMCRDFINQFYQIIDEELKDLKIENMESPLNKSIIKLQRKVKCLNCSSTNSEQISSYLITLPLSISDSKYYQITYVPYCETLKIQDIKRYGFKLPLNATLKNYKDAFQAVTGILPDQKYLLMEVYANKIVKNYSTAKNQATLDQLLLRDTDTIVAYQLQTDFSQFISKHYDQHVDYETTEIKIDQFIDCKNEKRGWIFGKVCEKQYTPYGHQILITVIHKFSKGEEWQISYNVDQETVGHFPTKSYLNGEQYHLRLQQRYFNEASNDMEICNMPLVVVMTNWMRWREFYYMIYLQMKRFIKNDIQGLSQAEQEDNMIPSSKSIQSSRKKNNTIKLNKFKDFLYGESFPFKVNFVDYSGRCAICFKFLKTIVFAKQESNYCSGCKLSKTEPLSWQIKVSDVMVCIDWKSIDSFKKDVIKDHSTYANMSMQRKNDIDKLETSFNLLQNGYDDSIDQICCASNTPSKIYDQIKQAPENLILYLDRVIEENGFIKTLNKHVKFEDELHFKGVKYCLKGVTALEGGSHGSTKYRTFINFDDDQWVEYDGKVVKITKKNIVERMCALNLYYQKK